ncbi:MAG: hypothetical protein U1E11_07665, partial [Dethiobacteria bacterium]|nr:hypothetical protein [Dethiobacteria bacterium]
MRKALPFFVLFLVLSLFLGFTFGCGQDQAVEETAPPVEETEEVEEAEEVDVHDFPENNEAMAEILAIVTELGERLNEKEGYYGDLHDIVVANGNREGAEHDELYELFHAMLLEVESTYLYSFIDGGGDLNLLIVDGGLPEDQDDFGAEYAKEPWTIEAFATGEPTVSKRAWMDDSYGLQKSAFAPIFNSKGEVSFLLGIDYP